MTIKYKIEDVILRELQRQSADHLKHFKVDDVDVGLVHLNGTIDIGRIAEHIHSLFHSFIHYDRS